MEMDRNDRIIYPELPKIRIKKSRLSEVICVQIHTKSSGPRHFIRNLRRSGLKNPDYPRLFVYKYIQNHPDHGILSGIGEDPE